MKNIFKIIFASLLAITIPAGAVFASNLEDTMQNYVEQQQIQNITNGLSDISNSINTQIRIFQDALRQQQIEALDPVCVSSVVAQVRAKDGSAETQKMIDDYRNEMATTMDMSNPVVAQQASSYLNYLYKYLESQNTQLFNILIQYCPKNVLPQVQQTAPSTNLQCNGKAWLACPAGQTFFCPVTGDAQCIRDEAPVVTIPTTKNFQPSTEIQKPINNSKQVKSEPTTNTDNTPAPTPTYHKGLIPRFWSWFTGLFGL